MANYADHGYLSVNNDDFPSEVGSDTEHLYVYPDDVYMEPNTTVNPEISPGHPHDDSEYSRPQEYAQYGAPSNRNHQGYSNSSHRSDGNAPEVSGWFCTPAGVVQQTHAPQGPYSVARNMQHALYYGTGAAQAGLTHFGSWAPSESDFNYAIDFSEERIRQQQPGHVEQQSVLMTSFGRMPGHDANLARMITSYPGSQGGSFDTTSSVDPALDYSHTPRGPPQTFTACSSSQQSGAWNNDGLTTVALPDIVVSPMDPVSQEMVGFSDALTSNALLQSPNDLQSPRRASLSSTSVASNDVLYCSDCPRQFTGKWKKTNLARHDRSKHQNGGRTYPCKAAGCISVFKRSDARLKHYRKRHSSLAQDPVLRPRSSISTGLGSWEEVGDSSRGHSQLSPCDSRGIDDTFSIIDSTGYCQNGSPF
ncbi:hypothetical protein C7974DRAFT_62605 [Boeremia exigua]|uniref:uncharacterized protein n=1 Tax=Boeremia exigua TaxID=749465 RepID=UPI001E8D60A5|nr:uncharacterized protein C7974DRAFT_62605 [Boeremia exigua]KAH6615298.1 hypothetical protein C7974DRAFT_62605 [Boeremia exigua]